MKNFSLPRTLACAFLLALPIASGMASAASEDATATQLTQDSKRVGVARFTASDYKPGQVRHIVLVRFKDGITPSQRQNIIQAFLDLQKQSLRNGKPYIHSIETGTQLSGEGASRGFEQAFIVTFGSEGDRNYFIGTPIVTDPHYYESAHAKFKDIFKPLLAENGLISFDFAAPALSQ